MDKGGKDEPASSLPVSANELSAEAKSLRSVETQAHEMSKSEVMDVENSEERIRELYLKHGGDMEAIFQELGEHPANAAKAKKRAPKDAEKFAKAYVMGSYNVEESMRDRYLADAKSDAKEAK